MNDTPTPTPAIKIKNRVIMGRAMVRDVIGVSTGRQHLPLSRQGLMGVHSRGGSMLVTRLLSL